MSDVFNFPNNGYAVKVLRKEDVLASIDKNIIDKDVALAIVKRCEIDAANFLKEGRWAGIPFMGSIRIPKTVQMMNSSESKELLKEAQDSLEKSKYLLFRKNYANEIGKQVKLDRYYRYMVSKFIGRNPKIFYYATDKYNDLYARVLCYTLAEAITEINNEQI